MQPQTHFEQTKHDNFAFLQDGLEELYAQAALAERYYFTDRQSSMAKIRLFVELACHELGKHFKLRPPVHGDLNNKIKMLQASGEVEEWVIEAMNTLRHDGNRSVHMTEVNGSYIAKMTVSRARMQQHMNSLYEIAHYLGQTILGTATQCAYTWQEPMSCELTSFVSDAHKGSKEASFYLASSFYNELNEMSQQQGKSRWWHKEQYLDKQADLSYWLEKSHRQGHPQSWLLLAKCYSKKLLQEQATRDAKNCFKKALNNDEDGEAAYEFGLHLSVREESKLGEEYIAQAAQKGHHPALSYQLERAFNKHDAQQEWLDLALEHGLKEAYTVDAYCKLEQHQQAPNEQTIKALRSSLVAGQARRAPGIGFFKAYVDLSIYAESDVEKVLTQMTDNYACVPSYLEVELRLFQQISVSTAHYDLMNDIYHRAISQTSNELEAAEINYAMVKHALSQASEKFKQRESVKTPKPIPTLLKEAADAGHAEAREFINSTQGKAVLKKIGFTSQGKMQKNAAEKEKNKRKRKLAKKAKRK
ncbi:DUF4145 domain-containing protein [Vibrio agarivorans]|uniref:DUF4145 domain-containing protein n=1 Tax=Vibrio agarivorans TaxID=153622 RepID=UPI0025B5E952|nr:DUF4145 domain-containing protein [Vibrio agarivorans]MDN3660377.1 DUF4145 domain-containing protein [Vibrio agarivorans]